MRRYGTQLRRRTFNCSPRGEVSASAFRNSKGHTAPLRHTASTFCILLQLSPPPFLMLHSRTAIVPTRFIVSISHLIVVILCLMGMVRLPQPSSMYQRLTYIQDGNVLSGLALAHTDGEFTTAKDSLVAALVVTLICIGIGKDMCCFSTKLLVASHLPDFLGLFSGVTLKVNAMHAFQVRARGLPRFAPDSELRARFRSFATLWLLF